MQFKFHIKSQMMPHCPLRETEGFSHIVHLFVNLATEEELEAILNALIDMVKSSRTKSQIFSSL